MRVPVADFVGRDERRHELREDPTIVRVMHTNADGSVVCTEETRFASFEAAMREAERLQRRFDEDCEPKRAFVCDRDGVPIRAAGVRR